MGVSLQNIHNKGVASKIAHLNELAPESIRGLLVFDLYIHYIELDGTHTPTRSYFVCLV
jgi:hypothetical protein